jgi:outer membrane protein assembly factor BamB
MMRRNVWILSALALGSVAVLRADNWPHWRGVAMNGISAEKEVPLTWSATENVKWKTPLSGPGMSTPVVWGERIFLTQALDKEGTRRALTCFSRADGKVLWQQVTEFTGPKEATYDGEPHYCSASPATDGERVVAFFASAGLACYSMEGRPLWKKDLGRCEQIWGTASSPVIYKNLVLLNFGPGERTFLIALDKKTGEEKWRVTVPGKFGTDQKDWMGSWSTPIIAPRAGGDELIMAWPGEVRAYDPLTGKELWRCQGLGPLAYTSPLVAPDTVVQASGFGGPVLAVRRGGTGDVTETHRLWREEKAPQRIGSGVIVGEHVYLFNENGVAECRELKTGKTLWKERATGSSWSSLVAANSRLYATSQQGETVVFAAKPTFQVLARNPIGERTNSSLAVSEGELFLRTYNHLWCIRTSKTTASKR